MPDKAEGFSDAGRGIGSEGHRQRLRERFDHAGPEGLADYELLELLLFRSIQSA